MLNTSIFKWHSYLNSIKPAACASNYSGSVIFLFFFSLFLFCLWRDTYVCAFLELTSQIYTSGSVMCRPTLRLNKVSWKNYFTLAADPSLKIAKWNLIWAALFHLHVWEKHSVCLCIWILSPSTCLGFDFLTYSLAAFLLQCSVHCVVSHLLVSVSYLIPHVLPGNAGLTACFP